MANKDIPDKSKISCGDLFIVDNSDFESKVRQYLYDWSDIHDLSAKN